MTRVMLLLCLHSSPSLQISSKPLKVVVDCASLLGFGSLHNNKLKLKDTRSSHQVWVRPRAHRSRSAVCKCFLLLQATGVYIRPVQLHQQVICSDSTVDSAGSSQCTLHTCIHWKKADISSMHSVFLLAPNLLVLTFKGISLPITMSASCRLV